MRLSRTPKWYRDYNDLLERERGYIDDAFPEVYEAIHGNQEFRYKYHMKEMQGYPGIYEGHIKDNLVFTFHYEKDKNGNRECFFRRVGTHGIYKNP